MMCASVSQETDQLVTSLVAAFPGYIAGRLDAIGVIPDDAMTRAVGEAIKSLDADLRKLLSKSAAEQVESPLEVVRRATERVTVALEAAGVTQADRDDWAKENQPGDKYGLYPASSQQLGEQAWQLHLDWGVRKAEAVAGVVPASPPEPGPGLPVVALFGVPIDGRSRLVEGIERRGFGSVMWRNPAALENTQEVRPALAVVHLGHPGAHDAIRMLSDAGLGVVAVGEDVNDLTTPGILALGAREVVESSRLLSSLDRLLPDRA